MEQKANPNQRYSAYQQGLGPAQLHAIHQTMKPTPPPGSNSFLKQSPSGMLPVHRMMIQGGGESQLMRSVNPNTMSGGGMVEGGVVVQQPRMTMYPNSPSKTYHQPSVSRSSAQQVRHHLIAAHSSKVSSPMTMGYLQQSRAEPLNVPQISQVSNRSHGSPHHRTSPAASTVNRNPVISNTTAAHSSAVRATPPPHTAPPPHGRMSLSPVAHRSASYNPAVQHSMIHSPVSQQSPLHSPPSGILPPPPPTHQSPRSRYIQPAHAASASSPLPSASPSSFINRTPSPAHQSPRSNHYMHPGAITPPHPGLITPPHGNTGVMVSPHRSTSTVRRNLLILHHLSPGGTNNITPHSNSDSLAAIVNSAPDAGPAAAIDLSTKGSAASNANVFEELPTDLSLKSRKKQADNSTNSAKVSNSTCITSHPLALSANTSASLPSTSTSVLLPKVNQQDAPLTRPCTPLVQPHTIDPPSDLPAESLGLMPTSDQHKQRYLDSLKPDSNIHLLTNQQNQQNVTTLSLVPDSSCSKEQTQFSWEDYLEYTNSEAAPTEAFRHVEASVQNYLQPGMIVEVCNLEKADMISMIKSRLISKTGQSTTGPNVPTSEGDTYWVASIVMNAGQLLRLRYVGCEEDTTLDFWKDMTAVDIKPIGWCGKNGKVLHPPQVVKERVMDITGRLTKALHGCRTPPGYLLNEHHGTTPVEQLHVGMIVEVSEALNPLCCWVARIMANVGGRLKLRYEGIMDHKHDFWLFYLDYRINPIDTQKAQETGYRPPTYLAPNTTSVQWSGALQAAFERAVQMPLPGDVFRGRPPLVPHRFGVGMKLECLHPMTRTDICPATVKKVFNEFLFLVQLDSTHKSLQHAPVLCCHAKSPGIFPIHWAEINGIKITPPPGYHEHFEWEDYLTKQRAIIAPENLFLLLDNTSDEHFVRGQKLESVHPRKPHLICAATITRIIQHLMWIHINCVGEGSSLQHIVDTRSMQIFPVGWCDSNGYQISPPKNATTLKAHTVSIGLDISRQPAINQKSSQIRAATYAEIQHGGARRTWCPKIYYNPHCFSGPFLSKGRISILPRSIGPGPVHLVLTEVLNKLIKIAYKSTQVLKDLELEGKPNCNMTRQTLKAKYKGKKFTGVVEICKTADQVEEFCRQICIKLECCPLLFSPHYINGKCPEKCHLLTKNKANCYNTKKKKKKTMRIMYNQTQYMAPPPHTVTTGGCGGTATGLAGGNKLGTPKKGRPRKDKLHVLPPSLIQTRGAKQPKFTIDRRTHKKIMITPPEPNTAVAAHVGTRSPLQSSKPDRNTSAVETKATKTYAMRHKHQRSPCLHGKHHPKYTNNNHHDIKSGSAGQKTIERQSSGQHEVLTNTMANPSYTYSLHYDHKHIVTEYPQLSSNPLSWTVKDVVSFLENTDCRSSCELLQEQAIDGQALMLLNLPACQDYLNMKLGPAVKLCHQIEKIKVAFFELFAYKEA